MFKLQSMIFYLWFNFAREFVSKKRLILCQIIYVINQDRKDVVYVTVIFTLKNILVPAVPHDSGPSHAIKNHGSNSDVLWNVFLEAILSGT